LPPPKLQVRVPAPIPNVVPPPPVNITPTPKEERVEYKGPPVNIPGPPPPPAPPAPVRPPVITSVNWSRQPRPEFPERAQERGIEEGTVVLSCTVQPNGSATNCSIVSETPTGAGFGREALSSMRSARFSPGTVDGVAQGGTARFTVRFRLQ
ncbi:TonB family protein, partial [Pseudomonas sp. ODNR1LW]|nr:TonB family protein [Pseudomonas sp. ODNR1LW]